MRLRCNPHLRRPGVSADVEALDSPTNLMHRFASAAALVDKVATTSPPREPPTSSQHGVQLRLRCSLADPSHTPMHRKTLSATSPITQWEKRWRARTQHSVFSRHPSRRHTLCASPLIDRNTFLDSTNNANAHGSTTYYHLLCRRSFVHLRSDPDNSSSCFFGWCQPLRLGARQYELSGPLEWWPPLQRTALIRTWCTPPQ